MSKSAKSEIRLYRGEWVSGDGWPWVLAGDFSADSGRIGIEQFLFFAGGRRSGTAIVQQRTFRCRPGKMPIDGIDIELNQDYLFEVGRAVAEADLQIYLDEKSVSERRSAYELRPVELRELFQLWVFEESRLALEEVAGKVMCSSEMRRLFAQLDGIPAIKFK